MKEIITKLMISIMLWIIISIIWQLALTPVHQWGSVGYDDEGEIIAFYEHASPNYWNKWTNSLAWQEFETYWEGEQ